jgi:hypothetical protein
MLQCVLCIVTNYSLDALTLDAMWQQQQHAFALTDCSLTGTHLPQPQANCYIRSPTASAQANSQCSFSSSCEESLSQPEQVPAAL